ncbi:MAG: hypothetical protein VCA55_04140 [Verrucomicrobiales bacterium]
MIRNFACLAFLFLAVTAPGNVVISEVDLANSRVELVNTGSLAINITNHWWCNKVNGEPDDYPRVSSATINKEFSTTPDLVLLPGEVLVFDLSSSFLPRSGGELGLYRSRSWKDRAAMIDYINWGNSRGVRDTVADDPPAIWEKNAAIDISSAAPGDTIQLKPGAAGDSVNDYQVASASIGLAQSVVPVELRVTGFGTLDSGSFFIEFYYNGNGTVKATESADLSITYTDISARTSVSRPSDNRVEFQPKAGRTFFFRFEEE